MTDKPSFADKIAEMGDAFQPDAMPDWDDRIKSGEFANLSMDEIREIYLKEARQEEEDDEHNRQMEELRALDEADDIDD